MKKQELDLYSTGLLAVADAAVVWWTGLRPIQWSLEQHIAQPRIGTASQADGVLASAVAEWCALQAGLTPALSRPVQP